MSTPLINWRWRWTLQHVQGLFKPGELRVLGLALLTAVAASSAVTLFSDRVGRAISQQSGETLGADYIISSRTPMDEALAKELAALPLQQTLTIQLPSVIWHGERSHLGGIKAVHADYPLKGSLRVATGPVEAEQVTADIPARGEAWADSRLWSELGLSLGDKVEVGASELTVTQLLTYEPDRGSGFIDIAPRLMIHADDLPATQLLQPGSRAEFRLMLAGDVDSIAKVETLSLPRGVKGLSPRDARPEIRSAMQRADAFLGLAAMTASLLGAIAIALCAHQFAQSLRKDVALLRCLGASRAAIVSALLSTLLAIGLIAGGAGAAIGWAAQWALQNVAELLQLQTMPPPRLAALGPSVLLAAILLGGFALPSLLSATATSPVRVFQNDAATASHDWALRLAAVLGLVGLLAAQSPELDLLLYVGLGQAACMGLLALLAWPLLRLLQPLRGANGHQAMRGWRMGLGNLLRRPALSLVQSVALSLGLLALLLLTVVRHDLLLGWQNKLPADTPNQFLINVQADQVTALGQFLDKHQIASERIWPMARSRLIAINGQAVSSTDFEDPETQRWINRDFNLSWTDRLGADNKMVEGQWWDDAGQGQPWLSVDTYARDRLQLKLGDELSLDFAGQIVTLTVHNVREVDWESFQPNFFLLSPPGVLDAMPATWLTSFYLPPEQKAVLRELSNTFPNITVLDLDVMMQQVRSIMQRIVSALELVFLFTVAAGLTVLLAAMETGRSERAREMALMRTLGASKREIRSSLLAEFAALGLLSGLVAALCSQLAAFALATWVFKFDYHWNLLAVIMGTLGSAALVCGLAWLSLRRVITTPPDRILRQ